MSIMVIGSTNNFKERESMKGLFLAVVLGLISFFSFTGCVTHSCITPPISSVDSDKKKIVDITAKLDKLQASGELKTDFETTLKQNFDKLNDSNAALLLFLNAIDCYLQRGKVGQDVAREMVAVVRARWGAKNGLAGTLPTLTPVEKQIIDKSQNATAIYGRLEEFGVH